MKSMNKNVSKEIIDLKIKEIEVELEAEYEKDFAINLDDLTSAAHDFLIVITTETVNLLGAVGPRLENVFGHYLILKKSMELLLC